MRINRSLHVRLEKKNSTKLHHKLYRISTLYFTLNRSLHIRPEKFASKRDKIVNRISTYALIIRTFGLSKTRSKFPTKYKSFSKISIVRINRSLHIRPEKFASKHRQNRKRISIYILTTRTFGLSKTTSKFPTCV